MRRREFIKLFAGAAVACPLAAQAQQSIDNGMGKRAKEPNVATIESNEKRDCTPLSPDQAGASGAFSNSAIAMMPPGEALPTSQQERVLGIKIARAMLSGPHQITKDATVAEMGADGVSSSSAKAPTIGSAFPEMRT